MKLAEVLNHDNGLEMTYMVGCYERFRQCHFPHDLQTSLCRYELYQEELSSYESEDLLKALSQYNNIQSPRVYHFGKVGIDEFRIQRLIQNNEITDTFQLTPTTYNSDHCDQYKKKAEEYPFIKWNPLKIGIQILAISLFAVPILKNAFICFRTSKNLARVSAIQTTKKVVQETEKLAAGFLLYLSAEIVLD